MRCDRFIPDYKAIRLAWRKIVGWVKQSATQQSPGNVGLPCGNAKGEQVGKPAQRSGSPTYTV
ncbi:hypothetical protein [Nostoc sp. UHCC 0251]|uniref:hypothetical protein n=1 Tax=Nostoc sp. UHCC 0251 TaxID=3110240 RepID=UPI002B20EAA1|nr:hypothetical protein [Nostoc sp. UHCC 0251]MEA5628017.1 hypothetical protein [Nostoc sp. UHCC 0251]